LRFKYDEGKYDFNSADEVIQLINSVMNCLQMGRSALFVPKKRTTDELQSSRNMKVLQPHAPHDLAISFYIQSHKLICAVYLITRDSQNNIRFESISAETSVPWLSQALVLFTICLQFCQQLKDKIAVFVQYKEMHRSFLTDEEEEEETKLKVTSEWIVNYSCLKSNDNHVLIGDNLTTILLFPSFPPSFSVWSVTIDMQCNNIRLI